MSTYTEMGEEEGERESVCVCGEREVRGREVRRAREGEKEGKEGGKNTLSRAE
jgi:hypothetical protein